MPPAVGGQAASGVPRGSPDLIGIQKPESVRGDRSGSEVRMCCRERNDPLRMVRALFDRSDTAGFAAVMRSLS